MVVLAMGPQVLGQMVDALGEHRDLDLGRAGVCLRLAEPLGDLALALARQRHGAETVAAAQTRSASPMSRFICSTSASTDSKRRSPRSRFTNATRSSSPYRSPSNPIRYASTSSPRPVWNC